MKFVITVMRELGENDTIFPPETMVQIDRCTLTADDTRDAAGKYAALFTDNADYSIDYKEV